MRINCHAHLFNVASVFTPHTLDILLNRIVEMRLPDFIQKELAKEIQGIMKKAGDYVDEERMFKKLIHKISTSGDFKMSRICLASSFSIKSGSLISTILLRRMSSVCGVNTDATLNRCA